MDFHISASFPFSDDTSQRGLPDLSGARTSKPFPLIATGISRLWSPEWKRRDRNGGSARWRWRGSLTRLGVLCAGERPAVDRRRKQDNRVTATGTRQALKRHGAIGPSTAGAAPCLPVRGAAPARVSVWMAANETGTFRQVPSMCTTSLFLCIKWG